MPPLPPVPSCVKLAFQYDNSPIGGYVSRAVNILYLQYGTGVTISVPDCLTIANGAMTWWSTHFKASVTSYWRLSAVLATVVDGSGNQSASSTAAVSGTASPPAFPPQSCVAVSWLGLPSYRGGKPRTYLPGVPESAGTPGTSQLIASYCSTLRTAAQAAILDMTPFTVHSATPALGTVSYINKGVNPVPPHHRPSPIFYSYTGARVHERLDSQRRRSGKENTFPAT